MRLGKRVEQRVRKETKMNDDADDRDNVFDAGDVLMIMVVVEVKSGGEGVVRKAMIKTQLTKLTHHTRL